jgi:hypothetical protein
MQVFDNKEITFKKEIISKLIDVQDTIKKHTREQCLPEQFVRGFIMGAETAKDIKLPSHWYDEIIQAIKTNCGEV